MVGSLPGLATSTSDHSLIRLERGRIRKDSDMEIMTHNARNASRNVEDTLTAAAGIQLMCEITTVTAV
ncbi:unnamed protein product [Cylicocyclus nassatus]|uniref:Uncharacterized protein n=1 Tax=Cylicocyclus nassatus TaxID=53992 RepID=A0AA36H3V1_CYLNA|nr:unnamed protein product [Cylicocyclus nassatus]